MRVQFQAGDNFFFESWHCAFRLSPPLPHPRDQNDAEGDIRELEGVMEIDFTPAAATQSPPAPETPGGLMSQGSASGEPEWSLPEVLSVTPPSVVDCHDLLARVQSLL